MTLYKHVYWQWSCFCNLQGFNVNLRVSFCVFVINFVDHFHEVQCTMMIVLLSADASSWLQYLCQVIDIWAIVTCCCTENNAEMAIAAIWFQFMFMYSHLSSKYWSAQTMYNNQLWTRTLFLSRVGILCVINGPSASYLICSGNSSLRSRVLEHEDVFSFYP